MRIVCLLVVLNVPIWANAQPDSIRNQLQARLLPEMARAAIPGFSVGVVQRGQVVWAGGLGVKAAGTHDSVTAGTRFQAGSISKSLTAMLVLRPKRQGKLTLDADVRSGLQTWTLPTTKHTQAITPRMLLQHRAGINLEGSWGYPADKPAPTLVQFLNGEGGRRDDPPVRKAYTPGKFRYSTGGYAVLEQYLQDTQQRDFAVLVEQEVFAPLHLQDSDLAQPSSAPDLAAGHNAKGVITGQRRLYPFRAAAGWNTTGADLALFCKSILDAYHGRDTTWLRRADIELLLQVPPGADYGLGWRVESQGTKAVALYHRGLNSGFMGIVKIYLKADYAVAILGNHEDAHRVWPVLTAELTRLFPPQ